ncbi:MAG TPA: addiction module protein [Candidatus Binatia bacterium]
MAKAIPNPPPGFDELSIEDKIEYVQSLWDRIAASPKDIPVPEWHSRILDERLESHRDKPAEGKVWEQIQKEIRRKLSGSSSD